MTLSGTKDLAQIVSLIIVVVFQSTQVDESIRHVGILSVDVIYIYRIIIVVVTKAATEDTAHITLLIFRIGRGRQHSLVIDLS